MFDPYSVFSSQPGGCGVDPRLVHTCHVVSYVHPDLVKKTRIEQIYQLVYFCSPVIVIRSLSTYKNFMVIEILRELSSINVH